MHRNTPDTGTDTQRRTRALCTTLLAAVLAIASPFASAERVLLLVDNSGSMQANDADRLVPSAVENFIASLPADTRIGVISFDTRARLLQSLIPADEFRASSLDRLDYAGQLTDPSAGVELALYELRRADPGPGGDSLVLITDGVTDLGNPVASARAEEWLLGALREDLRAEGVAVWGIALTEAADARMLRQLTNATGGDYFRAADASAVRQAITNIENGIALRRVAYERPETRVEAPAAPALTATRPETPPVAAPTETRAAPAPVVVRPVAAPTSAEPEATRARWWLALTLLLAGTGMLGWVSYATWRSGRDAPRPEKTALEYFPECYLVDLQGVTDRPTHLLAGKYNMITRLQTPPDDGINYVQIFRRQIGRRHALVEYRDFSFWIIDQNSVNGTFVNGERIHHETRLKHGDRLRFHIYEFEFCVSDLAFSNETLMDRKGAPTT